MLRYTLYRCVVMVPTLLIASIVIFTIIELPPGDYFESYVAELQAAGESVDPKRSGKHSIGLTWIRNLIEPERKSEAASTLLK